MVCLIRKRLNVEDIVIHRTSKFTNVLFFSMFLASCDQVLNKAGSEYLKVILKDTCGEDDVACVAAVDGQFDVCHRKYEAGWNKYMNSYSSNEDELLKIYSEKMYGCIVDENGAPYFVFDPE